MTVRAITDRVRAAEASAGRPQGAATLVAVSKVQPLARIEAVLEEVPRLRRKPGAGGGGQVAGPARTISARSNCISSARCKATRPARR